MCLASELQDLSKQCRPWSDATERGIWSGSTLFAYRNFYLKWNQNEKVHQTPLKLEMDITNLLEKTRPLGMNRLTTATSEE